MQRLARCRECGADRRLDSGPCPLCGAHEEREDTTRPEPVSIDAYQARVRRLRAELERLRGGHPKAG